MLSPTSRAIALGVSSGPPPLSINDSFSEDELHIVLPDDSFTAPEPASDIRLQVSPPVKHSSAPHSAAVSSPPAATNACQLSAVSDTADLVPCIADIFAETLLFCPLSPVQDCQQCTECGTGNRVIVTRKRSITQRRLSEHSDDENDTSVKIPTSSDHVRATINKTHPYLCLVS